MTREEYEAIAVSTETDYGWRQASRVIHGMELMVRLTRGKCEIDARHEEIFLGGPQPYDSVMTDDDVKDMLSWGWHWDASVDSWSMYT